MDSMEVLNQNLAILRDFNVLSVDHMQTSFSGVTDVGSRRRFVEGTGPQRSAGPVSADDDARGRSLRVDEREFAWRGSIRKETFACV